MGKIAIIPEKPSVAGDIAMALGGFKKNSEGYYESDSMVIVPARGHLVELSYQKDLDRGWGLSVLPFIPAKFSLEPIENSASQLRLIGKVLKRPDIDAVVNACDAGREGELIFRYICLALGCKKPTKRMWLRTMTPEGIRDGYANMKNGAEYDNLFYAGQSRSEADFLVGVNATRAMTSYRELIGKSEGVASAGRVQSVVLAMLCDREWEIKNFVPRDYWEIVGEFSVAAGNYDGRWFDPQFQKSGDEGLKAERIFDEQKATAILEKCRGVNPSSVTEESVPTKKLAPKLFDLTALQREANSKFGMSAKDTLDTAQALYETHKVLTYPRTSSSALPEDYVQTSKDVLASFSGTQFAEHAQRVLDNGWVKPDKRIFDNSKISDHFAIIPTGKQASGLTENQQKIYDLVVKRFIAIFHPAAEFLKTTRITVVSGESFKSFGSVLVSQGWLLVYGRTVDGDDDGKSLCRLAPGETGATVDIRKEGLKTKAPDRYTEATLLAAMEFAGRLVDDEALQEALKKCGIGTPATRAATIEDMLSAKRMYARREKKYLVPMEKGMEVIALLRENGVEALTMPEMTGEWEFKLAQMEEGKYTRSQFMSEVREMTQKIVDQIRDKARSSPSVTASSLKTPCPKCKSQVFAEGKLYACACGFKMWRDVAGYRLTSDDADALLSKGETGYIESFISPKTQKKFTAKLVFDADFTKATFAFPPKPEAPAEDERERVGACPKCKGDVIVSGEHYDCVKAMGSARTCDFRVWGVIAGKRLSKEVVDVLLRNGRSGLIDGFKSSKGKKKSFSAILVLKNGKVEFEFEKNT